MIRNENEIPEYLLTLEKKLVDAFSNALNISEKESRTRLGSLNLKHSDLRIKQELYLVEAFAEAFDLSMEETCEIILPVWNDTSNPYNKIN